jgi:general secretion pathway protein D
MKNRSGRHMRTVCYFCVSLCAGFPWTSLPEETEPLIVQQYPTDAAQLTEEFRSIYEQVANLVRNGASEPQYAQLLDQLKILKVKKEALQERWRKSFADEAGGGDENYALWDMGETTLSQLVMEYGASDYLYVIPPELSSMKISLYSNIPLPRESWGEMMEMVLVHNGVGVKKLNPWVKQLYILKLDPSAIEGVFSREEDLSLADAHARIFFVFSPKAEQVKSVLSFFERFSDPRQSTVQAIASKIVIISTRETVEKLLGLYHAVWEKDRGKAVRLVNLSKIAPLEAEKVLKAVFGDSVTKMKMPSSIAGGDDLTILVLTQGLMLAGESEAVQRGEKILNELEQQLEDPDEKVVYWYSCKHSNPEDIASVLSQVYDSLIGVPLDKKTENASSPLAPSPSNPSPTPQQEPCPTPVFPCPSTAFNPVMPVNPGFIQPGIIDSNRKSVFGSFIVDAKTASILMVVCREELAKIKTLLRKLDVPKRMVQIDVMLVEKTTQDRRQVGVNYLNINSNLGKTEKDKDFPHDMGISFQTDELKPNKGIFQYLFQLPAGNHFPGVDLAYHFLIAQEDLRINANPTLLAVNQTPAQIAIVEEISINNGAIQLNSGVTTIEKSYTRAQYGTTIVMVPTIHLPDLDEDPSGRGFVSLHTDINFDTTRHALDDRPSVTRRKVTNDVQVADGETVILGGLRRKSEDDRREKIPFLGDLPGIGKLFGMDKATDSNTEMFIFITPHIIRDPVDDLRRLRQEEYQKRAGDIPEFLSRLDDAKQKERKRLFSNSLKMLFDKL